MNSTRWKGPRTVVNVLIDNLLSSWNNDKPPFEDVIHPRVDSNGLTLITRNEDVISFSHQHGLTVVSYKKQEVEYKMIFLQNIEEALGLVVEFNLPIGNYY